MVQDSILLNQCGYMGLGLEKIDSHNGRCGLDMRKRSRVLGNMDSQKYRLAVKLVALCFMVEKIR